MSVGITGIGAVSALGIGVDALWDGLAHGRDGIVSIDRFSTEGFSLHLGALVPWPSRAPSPVDFATLAAREALARARVSLENFPVLAKRTAIVMGTSLGDGAEKPHVETAAVARALGVLGPALSVSTACTSSTNALGLAKSLLDHGDVDLVIAGGADVLSPDLFAGFHALGALSIAKCSPFGKTMGTTLGEGAGFVVMERHERARERGATELAWLAGTGLSSDAYHATAPDPTGAGVTRALRAALADARVPASLVDYVNAHGTGTEANDAAEWRALRAVFGAHLEAMLVSSTKGHLGHAQGAAGILEILATLVCMEHGSVPPTLHFQGPRPRCPADPVAQTTPRKHAVRHAVSSSSAFGGANAAVVLGAVPSAPVVHPPRPLRAVYVATATSLGRDGLRGTDALHDDWPARLAEPSLDVLLRGADTRGLNRSERMLAAVVARALGDASLVPRGDARERTGLFLGVTRSSPESVAELEESVRQRGLVKLSATAFPKLVLNAPGGTATKLLGLRGPSTAISMGEGSGLLALVYAARELSSREDADTLVAAGLDELAAHDDPSRRGEGAACVVLTVHHARSCGARVVATAIGGPDDRAFVEAEAARAAGLATVALEPSTHARGAAEAASSLYRAAAAIARIRAGEAYVIVSEASPNASCAVVFAAEKAEVFDHER